MGKTKQMLKKALAVTSSAALLFTCGAVGTVSGIIPAGITAQAATAVATQLKVLDSDGKDLGDNPIIYLDTSEAAGADSKYHNVKKMIKIVASNDNGVAINDKIRFFKDGDADDIVDITAPSSGTGSITATLAGGYWEGTGEDRHWVEKSPGTTQLYFTTSSGEVYRTVTIITYKPATDISVSVNMSNGESLLDLNDYNLSNSTTTMTIANHKYQFNASPLPSDSTDTIEWKVVDGDYEGGANEKQVATKKAEINADGLFTPKLNGTVTIIAKCKKTETTPRDANYGPKNYYDYDEDGNLVTKTYESYKNVPKYIHVVIVKENPAKALKITNAPSAIELNKSVQLKYEATPTYTGSGYESGATDEFTWESSDPNVITVDDKGLIKAVGKGDAKITVYGENQNVFAEANIRVVTKASSISFGVKTISTRVGNSETIKAIMYPATADEEIEWKSSNTKIATVKSSVTGAYTNEQTAVIKGVSKGVVTITARAKNSGVEANITCNVEDKIVSSDVLLTYMKDGKIINIKEGDTVNVYDQNEIAISGSLISADGASPDDTIVWKIIGNGTNNSDYVDVTSMTTTELKLTGFAKGTVTVVASSKAIPSVKKTFKLKVLKKATRGAILDKATNSSTFHSYLNVGAKMQLGGDLTIDSNKPYAHDDKIARWTSDNKKAVTIDNAGNLKAVGNGNATITMITESGYTLSTYFTVFTTSSVVIRGVTKSVGGALPYADVVLDNSMTGTTQLSADVFNERDETVNDVALTWTSSNEAVATVDENGVVTGRQVGDAKITVKSGNKTDTCIVHVTYPIESGSLRVSNVYYSPKATEYRPEVIVYAGDENGGLQHILKEGKDYTITYSNNKNVGDTGYVEIKGKGSYTGTYTSPFYIYPKDLAAGDISFAAIADQELKKSNYETGTRPVIKLVHEGYRLVENKDYTVYYSGNNVPGEATAMITGIGNYSGTFTANFKVYCNHSDCTDQIIYEPTCQDEGLSNATCNICGHTFERVLPVKNHTFVAGEKVEPTYFSDGYTVYNCSVCGTTEKRDFVPALHRVAVDYIDINVPQTNFVYDGTVHLPEINVSYNNIPLYADSDYSLSYLNKTSKKVGDYTVKIAFKGAYTGTYTVNYSILPVATSITLSNKTLKMFTGESGAITATATPAKAAGGIVWSSDNEYIVSVDQNGKLLAVSEGTAVVTATSGSRTAKCTVTVAAAPFSNNSTLSAEKIKLGQTVTVKFAASGSKKPYQYSVQYKEINASSWTTATAFSANTKGSFKPAKLGTYLVRAKIKDSKGNISNKDFVLVVEKALKNNSSLLNTTVTYPDSTEIICAGEGGDGTIQYHVSYKHSASKVWITLQDYSVNKYITFYPSKTGSYSIKVRAMDDNGTVVVKTLSLNVLKPLVNKTKVTPLKLTVGGKVSVVCSATGGNAPYQYKIDYKKSSDSKWTSVQNYSSNAKATITPTSAGYYRAQIIVKDAKGKEIYKLVDFQVFDKLTLTAKADKEKITAGESFTVTAAGKGGDGSYKYAVYTKKSTQTKWTTVQNYKVGSSVSILAASAGTYNVRVKVKDGNNKIATQEFSVKVIKVLNNYSKLLSTNIIVGARAVVTCKATGGETAYNYAVYYRKAGASSWTTVQNYSTTAKAYIKPDEAGEYEVLVKVKDANGKVAEKQLTFKAADKLVNDSTLSASSVKVNETVKLKFAAKGGEGYYTYYACYVKAGTSTTVTLQKYAATKDISFSIKTAGTYTVKAKVMDAAGKIVIKKFTLTVTK